MQVYYARLEDFDDEWLVRVSDPDTRERVMACMRRSRSLEIALGRVLARLAAARQTGRKACEIVLAHDKAGRPFFPGIMENVSISRSDGASAVLIRNEKAVLDLQAVRRFPGEAVRGFFSPGEFETILRAADRNLEMTRIFCRRECLVKWMGRRPPCPGWDADEERAQSAAGAVFSETWIDGALLTVLGPEEALEIVRIRQSEAMEDWE